MEAEGEKGRVRGGLTKICIYTHENINTIKECWPSFRVMRISYDRRTRQSLTSRGTFVRNRDNCM